MLKLEASKQKVLLELADADLKIAKLERQKNASQASQEISSKRSEIIELADQLLSAQAKLDNLEQQAAKVLDDISLTNARRKHDESKINELTSEREVKAINHELDSLTQRLDNLETQELELLDLIKQAGEEVAALVQLRTKKNLELEELIKDHEAVMVKIESELAEVRGIRTKLAETLGDQVLELYDKKSARGIAVAQIDGRDCTACRLAINGVNFDALMSEPVDHVPTCPNCDALLVRN